MKFGRQLAELVDPKFRNYCISYNMLKGFIAETDTKKGKIVQTIQDVTSAAVPFLPPAAAEQLPSVRFQEVLNGELEKLNKFCELEEDTLLNDLGSLIRRIRSVSDREEILRTEADRIGDELCAFSSFIDLNYTAFRKITKKESKVHKTSSSAWFMANVARAPFMTIDFDRLVTALALCFELIRGTTLGDSTPTAPIAPSGVRRVLSAWVSTKDLLFVKVALAKAMTLQVSRQGLLDWVSSSSALRLTGSKPVRAVYYDTPWLDAYKQQSCSENVGGLQIEFFENDASCRIMLPTRQTVDLAADNRGQWESALRQIPEAADLLNTGQIPLVECTFRRSVFFSNSIQVYLDESAAFTAAGGSKLEDHHSIFEGHVVYIMTEDTTQLPDWLLDITGMPGVTEVDHFSKRVHGLFVYAENKIGAGIPYPGWVTKPVAIPTVSKKPIVPMKKSTAKPIPSSNALSRRAPVRSCWDWLVGNVVPQRGVVRDAILKIEPKSFFACERNLLDWIHVCVILVGLCALQGGLVGTMLGIVPVLLLVWETRIYRLRISAMTEKENLDYSDSVGPALFICMLLLLSADVIRTTLI